MRTTCAPVFYDPILCARMSALCACVCVCVYRVADDLADSPLEVGVWVGVGVGAGAVGAGVAHGVGGRGVRGVVRGRGRPSGRHNGKLLASHTAASNQSNSQIHDDAAHVIKGGETLKCVALEAFVATPQVRLEISHVCHEVFACSSDDLCHDSWHVLHVFQHVGQWAELLRNKDISEDKVSRWKNDFQHFQHNQNDFQHNLATTFNTISHDFQHNLAAVAGGGPKWKSIIAGPLTASEGHDGNGGGGVEEDEPDTNFAYTYSVRGRRGTLQEEHDSGSNPSPMDSPRAPPPILSFLSPPLVPSNAAVRRPPDLWTSDSPDLQHTHGVGGVLDFTASEAAAITDVFLASASDASQELLLAGTAAQGQRHQTRRITPFVQFEAQATEICNGGAGAAEINAGGADEEHVSAPSSDFEKRSGSGFQQQPAERHGDLSPQPVEQMPDTFGWGDREPAQMDWARYSHSRLPSPPLYSLSRLPSPPLIAGTQQNFFACDAAHNGAGGGGGEEVGGEREGAGAYGGDNGAYEEEDMLSLVYDPVLMCYYERTSGRYFQLKEGVASDVYPTLNPVAEAHHL